MQDLAGQQLGNYQLFQLLCSLASNGKCNAQAGASGTWKVERK
jgi:hypothetical protein